jgi:tetratricopeptide (TPR) repeat protein
LWPSIAGRIGQARPERRSDTTSRRFSFTLPQLVAASLALMLASGGMVWLARLGGPGTDFPPATASIRPANFADRVYQQAVDDLQRTLDAGRDKLDPQTVRILEQNLSAIDAAIVQCREALEADPANLYLNTYLAEARTRKLDLLRRAAAIVDSSS